MAGLARELGATHVASGFVPPPFVARLLARWIELAQRHIERDGWSRTSFPKTETEPWAWLADFLGDPNTRLNPSLTPILTWPDRAVSSRRRTAAEDRDQPREESITSPRCFVRRATHKRYELECLARPTQRSLNGMCSTP